MKKKHPFEKAMDWLNRHESIFVFLSCGLAYIGVLGASFFFRLDKMEPTLLTVGIFGALLALQFLERGQPAGRHTVAAACGAGFYTVCSLLYRYSDLGNQGGFFSLHSVLLAIGMFLLFFLPMCTLLRLWSQIIDSDASASKKAPVVRFAVFMAALLLAWAPMYLMYYPGRVCYDTTEQMREFLANYPRNHHPFLHSQLLKAILNLGLLLFQTPNGSVAFYCVLQMCAYSALFAWYLTTLREFGAKPWFVALAFLFFAFEPNIVYRTQVVEKDSTFALVFTLYMLCLWRLLVFIRRGDAVRAHVLELVLLGIGALGVCTMRSNGFYTFLPFAVLLCLALNQPFRAVKWISLGAALLTAVYLALIPALGIVNPDPIEALSIPLQNVSRVLVDGGDVSERDRELLGHLFDLDSVEENYTPFTSDTMKTWVRGTGDQEYLRAHKMDYLKLWIRMGLDHPRSYLYSWIDETCGYWHPAYLSPRDHYHTEGDMKDYLVDNPWGYYADPILSDQGIAIVKAYMQTATVAPVVSYFHNIGGVTWLAVLAFCAAIVKKRRCSLLLFAPYGILFALLLVTTPYNTEYRYLYPLMVALPMLFSVSLFCKSAEPGRRNAAIIPASSAAKGERRLTK